MQRKIITIAGSILLALGGVSAIVFSREYLARLILGAASRATATLAHVPKYKVVQVYYPSDGALLSAQEQIDMRQDRAVFVNQLVRAWLTQLVSERIILEPLSLQTASILEPGAIALLSFDGPLFGAGWSAKQKLLCLQSLFKTLQSAQVNAVQLLCNQEPMSDTHLDFSTALPVDGYA